MPVVEDSGWGAVECVAHGVCLTDKPDCDCRLTPARSMVQTPLQTLRQFLKRDNG
jgi:hypothetical protein